MWAVTRMTAREFDPYLDTLHSAFEMLESGVTLVHHIFAWPQRDPATRRRIDRILEAYADVGMRVSFSMAMRDQHRNHLLSDEEMLAGIPRHLRPGLARRFEQLTVPLDAQIALFSSVIFVAMSLSVDLAYRLLDPRIKYGK
jgi:cytosine/adenosine deaminase-related metal-dependent hydrolase